MITCDEIIAETKIKKKMTCKTKKLYNFVVFLLITIALLVAVSIHSYLIKYKAKQKHLLPYYVTNSKVKKVFFFKSIL